MWKSYWNKCKKMIEMHKGNWITKSDRNAKKWQSDWSVFAKKKIIEKKKVEPKKSD